MSKTEELRQLTVMFCDLVGSTRSVGIHSGPVVIAPLGSGAARELFAVGDTVNIAARLEGLAEPGTVIMSGATERLARGFVETVDLGTRTVAGVDEPVQVFRVLRPTDARKRVDAFEPAPLVARQAELALQGLRRRVVVPPSGVSPGVHR